MDEETGAGVAEAAGDGEAEPEREGAAAGVGVGLCAWAQREMRRLAQSARGRASFPGGFKFTFKCKFKGAPSAPYT